MKTLRTKLALCIVLLSFSFIAIAQIQNQNELLPDSSVTNFYSTWVEQETSVKKWIPPIYKLPQSYTQVGTESTTSQNPDLNQKGNWISSFNFGLFYALETDNSFKIDSNSSSGITLQMQYGRKTIGSYLDLYPGIDYGIQFKDRTKRESVLLSNWEEDKGKTQLKSKTRDLLVRAQVVYTKYPIKPYITVFAGTRKTATRQHFLLYNYSYNESEDTYRDKRKKYDLTRSLKPLGGLGLGTIIPISTLLTADIRYEGLISRATQIGDLNTSERDGINYTLAYKSTKPITHQIKLGLIWNLNPITSTNRMLQEGFWEEERSSVYFDTKNPDSSYSSLYCDCKTQPTLNWGNEKTETSTQKFIYERTSDFSVIENNSGLWVGLHYAQEGIKLKGDDIYEGYDLQILKFAQPKNSSFSIHYGGEIGLHFFDKGPKQDVVFNTYDEHLGYLQLVTNIFSLSARTNFEYSKHRFKPYFTLTTGLRNYRTQQKNEMYLPPFKSNEDRFRAVSRTKILSSMLFTNGLGIGTRFQLKDGISLDFRYEQFFTKSRQIIDTDESTYSTNGFNLAYKPSLASVGNLKIGFILHIAEPSKRVINEKIDSERISDITTWYLIKADEKLLLDAIKCDCDN